MTEIRPEDVLDYRNAAGHGWRMICLDGVLRVYEEGKTREQYESETKRVQDFQLRDDDVLIVAYPKCGTHWLWEIVTMIMGGSAEYTPHLKEITMLGMFKFEKAADMPSPRVLNSHGFFRHLPSQLLEKKTKIVHVMRNPKDVSVSMYHHFNAVRPPRGFEGTYGEFAELFMQGRVPVGSYFDYIKDWREVEARHPDLPILTIFYEDIKTKPLESIKHLSEFLCRPASPELCEKIVDACGFEKLKNAQKTAKTEIPEMKLHFKDNFRGFYRKGQIGDWKNWLTVAQNEAFDDVIKKELKDTGIDFTF